MDSSNLTNYQTKEWTELYYTGSFALGTITLADYVSNYNEILVITGRSTSYQSGIFPSKLIADLGAFQFRLVEYETRYVDVTFTSGSTSVTVVQGNGANGVMAIYGR